MKIQVGYGSDTRRRGRRGAYGSRNSGKVVLNGGFNYQPTVSFENISDKRWSEIFGTSALPKWKRELMEKGESLEQ